VEEASDTYQELFFRISVENLRPSELVWSPAFRPNRLAMATQTIYSNVVGLVALVCLAPILFVIGILSRLAAGPGPLFERTECAGFQKIPFFRLRFHTRDSRSGNTTKIGGLIERLRLGNLPQLINIVRGEMTLFGPQPVRTAFMPRLAALIPFYTQKLTVKPGLFSWAQVNARGSDGLCEESLRLEYDIYYLAQCSPSLDFEILVRTLVGGRRTPEQVPGR
jgi:lipopolysaccharide/colanic/teichoic acid biosynthesis glycosyltransferase